MQHMSRKPVDIQVQLREVILGSEMSRYRLARLTGVSEATLSLFVNGHRSITMGSAAKLAVVLGLELTPIRRRKKGG